MTEQPVAQDAQPAPGFPVTGHPSAPGLFDSVVPSEPAAPPADAATEGEADQQRSA